MTHRLSQGTTTEEQFTPDFSSPDRALNLSRLNRFALSGLEPMLDRNAGMFCSRIQRTEKGMAQEGISQRYTVMTLLGLHRLETAGGTSPYDIQGMTDTLLKDTRWANNIGDIGLLLWLCAETYPERLEHVVQQFDVRNALRRDATRKTTELSWFLAGLAHYRMVKGQHLSDLTDPAMEAYSLLKNNQAKQGLFGHSPRSGSISGFIRGHIGCFADQVYPIYALAKTSQAFGIEEAAAKALDCATTLCQLQGPLGQWWWHYDTGTGHVVGRYPVYSVHQEGMAPMALFALGEALQSDYSPWIYKGLQWITGANELKQDMRDVSTKVVWRCAYQRDHKRYIRTAISSLTHTGDHASTGNLSVLYECRPYELGWLLYAFGNHGLE